MTVVVWLLVLAGFVPLFARYSRSTRHVVVLAACLAPGVLVSAAVAGCVAATRDTALGLAVAWVQWFVAAAPLWTEPHPKPLRPLTVLTLNLRLGLAEPDAVLALVRKHRPDVLMLQELTPEALAALEHAGLAAQFEHRFTEPHPQGSGIGLFSRQPLTQQTSHPGFVNHVLSARVGELSVVAAHLGAPWPQSAWRWRYESEALAKILAGLDGPLVLGGDLNATRSHRVLRDLLRAGGVRDAVRRPTVRTFPARLPLLGIDHVLVRDLGVGRVRTAKVADSDHRALIVVVGSITAEE